MRGLPNCYENLCASVVPYGLSSNAIHDNLNLFQKTLLTSDGMLRTVRSDARLGDFVDFFAETDVLLAAALCPRGSGATELLRIARVSGMPSAIAEVKRSGIWCVALDPRGEIPAWEFDFTQRVCIVVGSEGEGVHRLVRERCDARVRLPVAGHIASFNASAAAAALLYEAMRQRATRPGS